MKSQVFFVRSSHQLVICGLTNPKARKQIETVFNLQGNQISCDACAWRRFCRIARVQEERKAKSAAAA